MSTGNSAATRPGRLVSSTIRSPRRAASRTLWVTNRTVSRWLGQSRSSSSCSRSRVMASRAPNGSSMSSTSASWARARARATRWRMPPESSWGRWSAEAAEVDELEQLVGPAPALGLARRPAAAGPARRCLRRQPGEQRRLLEHQRRCGRRPSTVPAVGWSSPATRLSRVVLPQPEAPTRQTNSPGATSSETRSRATHRARSPRPKHLGDARRARRAGGRGASGAVERRGVDPLPTSWSGRDRRRAPGCQHLVEQVRS